MEARECQTFLVHSRKEIEKKIDKFYGHVLVLTLGAFAFFRSNPGEVLLSLE